MRRRTGWLIAAACAVASLAPGQAALASPVAATAGTPAASTAAASTAAASAASAATSTPAGCDHPAGNDVAQCYAVIYHGSGYAAAAANQPPATALGPADIQSAYGLHSGAAGMTVAVVDALGYASAEADLATFRSYYGLPPCTTANGCFRKVDQNGGTKYPMENSGWAVETALDVDAISAACPACHILLVESNTAALTDMGAAEDTAVNLGAQVVSNSYGVPHETSSAPSLDHFYDHPGVAVVAATGDAGNVVNWPASSPDVTAAGGTKLQRDVSTPRGWTESAWSSGGSGCSAYEPQPDYQANIATGCAGHKAIADVSADADPASGLAVYTTDDGGWLQVGGTSLSSPLIAATYALAGTPVAGSYPVNYPYQNASALNDVTTGSDGTCGNVLCTAGPGWDGPTGLGTPDGTSAFTMGAHGTVTGTLSDALRRTPLADGTVSARSTSTGQVFSGTTDASGRYQMLVPAGTYDVTAARFGYFPDHAEITVTDGASISKDYSLAARPKTLLTGVVRDGSGLGTPMPAQLTVAGDPDGPVFTNPRSGRYLIWLPVGGTYQIEASAVAVPGYTPTDLTVRMGYLPVHRDFPLLVDQSTCAAPGYAYKYNASREQFTGWTGTTPQDGWSIVDNNGSGDLWNFSNPGGRTPPPGGDSDFAIVDSGTFSFRTVQNTSLVSPVIDLSQVAKPEIGFDTDYTWYFAAQMLIDVSLDGGNTWTNAWSRLNSLQGHVDIPIPAAAGNSDVRVRFTYTGHQGGWWSVDNVFVGSRTCVPAAG